MTPIVADLAGYRAAQLRKRKSFGTEVTFHFPKAATWPSGTVLDDVTGRPFDPMIEPATEEGRAPVTLSLSVAFKLTRGAIHDDTADTQVGDIKQNTLLTWVTLEEWGAPNCLMNATSFDYAGDNYLVRKATEESLGGAAWRMLIWGERQLTEGAVS